MHFFKALFVAASCLALAAAQNIAFTTTFTSIKANTPVQITWQGGSSSSPVTLILRAGNPNNLDIVMTITTDAVGGSYSWTPPSNLPVRTDYALEIKQGTANNYSNQFAILGGTGTTLPNASVTAVATVTANSTVSTTTMTDTTTTVSATARNTTLSTTTAKTTKTTASPTGSGSSGSTSVPNANSGAVGLASPLALVLSAVMAMIYLN